MADDSGFLAAFDRPQITMFATLEIGLPGGGALRLLDGSGQVTFSGRTFLGLDPDFGSIATLASVTDGVGDEAPSLSVGINTPTADAAAILGGQDMQGRVAYLWLGAFNPASASVIPDPLLIFAGEVDQATMQIGRGTRTLILECVSIWERLFDDNEGVRLSNAYHQSAWPGELGFEFVTDVRRQLPWGADTPRPQVISDVLYTRPNVTTR
jgi:hypothetical protein